MDLVSLLGRVQESITCHFMLPVCDAMIMAEYLHVDVFKSGVLIVQVEFGNDWTMYI